jgi:hypothetical protein
MLCLSVTQVITTPTVRQESFKGTEFPIKLSLSSIFSLATYWYQVRGKIMTVSPAQLKISDAEYRSRCDDSNLTLKPF